MTKHIPRNVVGSLSVFLAATVLRAAQGSTVLTLISPNEETNGLFGGHVAGAGDVNQDGFADVIVGAVHDEAGDSPLDAGRAYVLGGPDGRLLYELISPNEEADGAFGDSVAGAGDVNQDGYADVIVGAIFESPGGSPIAAGRAYVFSGQDGSLLYELASPNEEQAGEFGWSVAGAGDVDRDGFADLVVGAPFEALGGRAYVFSGKAGNLLFELSSPNEESLGWFGIAVAGAGDVNNDGVADVIVGAQQESPPGSPDYAGRAYVFSGQGGGLIFELASPNEEQFGDFGTSVAGAGDANQDGFADLIVGAPNESPGTSPELAGRAYVFSGNDGSALFELVSPNEQDLAAFGSSVAGAGDLDQDGVPDLIVGAYHEDPGTSPEAAGRVYLFSGKDGSPQFELMSPNEEEQGFFGYSVASAGDVNQDGVPDVVVGAIWEDPGSSPPFAGRAYVFGPGGTLRINSGGHAYTDTAGHVFVPDHAFKPGGYGYAGGRERRFDQPIGGTDDDPLYQSVRLARDSDRDGILAYRFDLSSPARYDVTLYLMAPALDGAGNVVMDVQAEGEVVFDDLDLTAEAGGDFQALVKTFAVDVNDGTLDLRFRAVNKAAVVSAISVAAQPDARGARVARQLSGGE